jgi:hypothetical protein
MTESGPAEQRPPDKRIVAKALEDFGDDWHWVILHAARELGPDTYHASGVSTVCGIWLDEGSVTVTLHDTGAPNEPTCPRCLDGGLAPSLAASVREALEVGDAVEAGPQT